MYFLSVKKSPTIVLEQIRTIWHKTDKGEQSEQTQRVAVQFQGLADRVPCEGLPGKKSNSGRSMAQGILPVADAVRQAGIPRKELLERMLSHKNYGSSFVLVDGDGNLVSKHYREEEVMDSVDFSDGNKNSLVILPGGNPHCQACSKTFEDKRGVHPHITNSPKHKQNVEIWQREQEALKKIAS